MKKNLVLLTWIVLLLNSCSADFFDKPVDINVNSSESKLAVTSILNIDDLHENIFYQFQNIVVSYSQDPLEFQYNQNGNAVENATVTVTGNNQSYTFEKDVNNLFYMHEETIDFIPGEIYTLNIEAPGYEPITSKQKIPQPVQILSAENTGNFIKVRIADEPNTKNFYLLQLFKKNSDDEYSIVYLDAFNTIFDNSGLCFSCLLFNDTGFDGEEFEFLLDHYFEESEIDIVSFKLVIYTTTEDYFRYDTTIRIAEYAQSNPFVEPVIIHNNIENGYGIFSIVTKTEREFAF